MPGHDGQAGPRGAVLGGPLVQTQFAFAVNSAAFEVRGRVLDRRRIKARDGEPSRFRAGFDGDI